MEDNIKIQLAAINQQIKDLVGLYRSAVARLGMSENELWIWYSLIVLEGDHSQQDICAMWSMSKQTVNTIISNLVRKGLICLETIPGTRNRKEIRLTEPGRAYGERVIRPLFEVERRALDKLTPGERAACTGALGKYIGFLRQEMARSQDIQTSKEAV